MKRLFITLNYAFLIGWSFFTCPLIAQTTLIITGPDETCVGDVSNYLFSPAVPGAVFTWSVSPHGSLLSSGSPSIVQWISTGDATLTVQGLDTAGIVIAQGELEVSINDIPHPNIVPSTFVSCAIADTLHIVPGGYCMAVCANSSVTYSVVHQPGAVYNWWVNGEQSFSSSGNTCTVLWGDAGFGDVSVEMVMGSCIGTDFLCLEIIEAPDALFGTLPEDYQQSVSTCLNSTVLFFDQSSSPDDSPIVSWVWDFGDGASVTNGIGAIGNPVEHTYTLPGLYEAKLVVTNSCGCTDSYTIEVEVSEYEGIEIECPAVICEGKEVIYTVDNPSCSGYSWSAEGGQILDDGSEYVEVVWDDVDEYGFGYLTYSNECGSCPGKFTVKIPVITDNAVIQGPTNVCPNTLSYYSFPQWPSARFHWVLDGNAASPASVQSNVFPVISGGSGSFTLSMYACNGLIGCDADTSITVTISPQAFVVGDTDVCVGSSPEYTLSGAATASWTLTSPSGVATTYTSVADIEPIFSETGTYTLSITGNFCSPDLFLIQVHAPPPPPSITGPDSTCVGVPTSFTSPQIPGATTYWGVFFGMGSVNPDAGPNTSVTFTNLPAYLGSYNELSEVPGCSSYSMIMISPSAPASVSISTEAPDNSVCGSSQWGFDVNYTGGDLYQWEVLDPALGSVVSGSNSPNVEVLFNNPLSASEEVAIIVAVTKCGQIIRDTLTVTVVNPPEYTASPSETTVCAGQEISFSVSPTPVGYSDFYWDFGDGGSSDEPNTTYVYPNNTSVAEFYAVATILNPEGCTATVVATTDPIEVLPAPVAQVSPAGYYTGCGSFSETLTATVTTGFGSTSNYTWSGPDASPPNCPTCTTWTIDQYGGPYYVVVENSYGCEAVSNEIYAIENCDSCPGPSPYLVSSDSSFVACAEVEANIVYNTNGTVIISENWTLPEEAIDADLAYGTNATASASFEVAGVYPFNYTVTYGDGTCPKTFYQNVYVPFVGDMRYTVTCGTGSNYDVTIYDRSNVFPAEVGSMVHQYAWNSGSGWTTITAPASALSVEVELPAGDYQLREIIYSNLTASAPPCTTIVDLILPDKPEADFDITSPFDPACINDVVVHFDNQSTPATGLAYHWDFGDESSNYQEDPGKVYAEVSFLGYYTISLNVTNPMGCQDTAQATIDVVGNDWWDGMTKPGLLMSPSPPICAGNLITLTYNSFPVPSPPNFTWYQGNHPVTPMVTSPSYNATLAGEYWVMGSDAYGCLVPSDPAQVYFTAVPTPTIIGNPAQCDNVAFTLTSSLIAPGISLEWERSPGGLVGSGSTLLETLDSGSYVYSLTASQNGCVGESVAFTVTVTDPVDPPSMSFDITGCEPYEVELTATHAQSGTFNWSTGATGTTAFVATGGLYEVYFTGTGGCTSSNEITIPFSPQEYLWHFPSGCFCEDDFPISSENCAGFLTIMGPYTIFDYWSYQVNGVDVQSGTNSAPGGVFTNFGPDSVNLILDNGVCEVISQAMYISESCSPEMQGISEDQTTAEALNKPEDDPVLPSFMTLVPNPAKGEVSVLYRGNGMETGINLEIVDLRGRTVEKRMLADGEGIFRIDLSAFAAGIYQVFLRQQGQVVAQAKLSVAP